LQKGLAPNNRTQFIDGEITMSAAPAPAPAAEGEAPAGGGKKKLIIIGAAVAVLLVGGGGGAFFMMKKAAEAEAAAAEGEDGGHEEAHAKPAKKAAPKPDKDAKATPPAFVPLDPFIVNLTDRDTDRFAQIGLNLQVDDPKVADEMKVYMPAIRNSILLILSHKSSEELLSPEGKEKLADEIKRDAARAMGYTIEDPEEDEEEESSSKKKKKKRKKVESYNPIVQVHYSTFVIQ
jgi:flagellar FliL protein